MHFSAIRRVLLATMLLALAALPASAQTYTLTATLSGAAEVPIVGTGAFGSATVVVDLGARTVNYRVDVFNLPSGVTVSHIHVGPPGFAGPVVINFAPPVTASNDFAYSGTVRDTEFALQPNLGIRSADDMFQAIIGGNTYVNVHSQVNGGGEIRGQLTLSTRP
jgi:hypothetical protein